MKKYNLVVIGGSIVGLTFLLALKRKVPSIMNIALVEAGSLIPEKSEDVDRRSIAISPGTIEILKDFGLWKCIQPRAAPIKNIHVSDRGHPGMTLISARQEGLKELGYVVESASIVSACQAYLEEKSDVDFLCPNRIVSLTQHDEHVEVRLSDGSLFETRLIVAADGTDSKTCSLLGLPADVEHFGQNAITADISFHQPHFGQAFERFTAHGPIALLPMTGQNRMSLVWCVDPVTSERLTGLDQVSFLSQLQDAYGWRMGALKKVGVRRSQPLYSVIRRTLVSHRVVVVGNAAQTLHPVAGQGFNLGIRDIATLVEELCINAEIGDVGRFSGLLCYQERRRFDRKKTIWLTSFLVYLFSSQSLNKKLTRNIGLALVDNLPLLRRLLLDWAIGTYPR